MTQKNNNVDWEVVKDFGVEWEEFQFSEHNNKVLHKAWEQYFNIFPWDAISKNSNGFDMGCGSGRWAQFVAPKVGKLSCIDPSSAIEVAKKNLSTFKMFNILMRLQIAAPLMIIHKILAIVWGYFIIFQTLKTEFMIAQKS